MNNAAKTTPQPQAEVQPTAQQTLQRIQSHFAATGAVRAEDLLRVFGDPAKGVSVTLPVGYQATTNRSRPR